MSKRQPRKTSSRDERHSLICMLSVAMIAVLLCVTLPLAAWAGETGELQVESPSTDVAQPSTPTSPAPASEHTTLYGSAKKHQLLPDGTSSTGTPQNLPHDLNAVDNAAKLQSEKAAADAYALAAQKLANHKKLTADEYRALGIGVTGYESYRSFFFFQKYARVNAVYKGSPADQAGIHVGDREIWNETAERASRDRSTLMVVFEQAGTTAEVTIVRDGKPVTMTLVRMNMEDIQEPRIRREWESMVRRLGLPQGTYTGTSAGNLTPFK